MTAVIGILNKSAVAIAADSAVTVSGPRGPKVFNRANKIFRLSKGHPIGVMIYNQGEFMGTPWEIIMKSYRRHLGDKSFGTVQDYKNDFIAYLHAQNFFCDGQQQKVILYYFLVDILQFFLRKIWDELQIQLKSNPALDVPTEVASRFQKLVQDEIDSLEKNTDFCDEFKGFTEAEFDALGFTGVNQAISKVLTSQGVSVPNLVKTAADLKKLLYLVIKSKRFYNFYSGLIFTGYGDNEIFPSLHPINISFALTNKLRFYDDDAQKAQITHSNQSSIRPFAQTDVINTVLSGIDPTLNFYYIRQFDDYLKKQNEQIAKMMEGAGVDPKIAGTIRAINTVPITEELRKLVEAEKRKIYVNPLMGAVITLSKEDLAEMAESLIYLTYLKRRFTFAEESVGGPVDVAVITKGDGFVWIKRKHYFKRELNEHFFKGYI